MDANPDRLLAAIREVGEEHDLSNKHRTALAWIAAKLLKEKRDGLQVLADAPAR